MQSTKSKYIWRPKQIVTETHYPTDILFNIALHASIDELEKLCTLNKQWRKICLDPYFWQRKYEHDGLIFPTTFKIDNWFKDYKVTEKVMQLLWLNDTVSKMINETLIMEVNVCEDDSDVYENIHLRDINMINMIPFPKEWKDIIDYAFIESYTHYILKIIPTGTHFTMKLDIYEDYYRGLDTLTQVDINTVINILKYIMAYQNQHLYLTDQYNYNYDVDHMNYHDEINGMEDSDLKGIVTLRKKLMKEYNIDFSGYIMKFD